LNSHAVVGYIAQSMGHIIGVAKIMTLAKPSGGIQPLAMGEAFYQLGHMALYLYFCYMFFSHLSLH
jgi:hypothetical protein